MLLLLLQEHNVILVVFLRIHILKKMHAIAWIIKNSLEAFIDVFLVGEQILNRQVIRIPIIVH